MKAGTTITGTLIKDAENFIDSKGQDKCRFLVAVNVEKQRLFCRLFFNTHIGEDQLKHFVKSTLCTFVDRYRESLNVQDAEYF